MKKPSEETVQLHNLQVYWKWHIKSKYFSAFPSSKFLYLSHVDLTILKNLHLLTKLWFWLVTIQSTLKTVNIYIYIYTVYQFTHFPMRTNCFPFLIYCISAIFYTQYKNEWHQTCSGERELIEGCSVLTISWRDKAICNMTMNWNHSIQNKAFKIYDIVDTNITKH